MRTQSFNTLKTIVLAIIFSIGLSYVYAWTAPTQTPPNGNVSAPINTSSTAQTKAGNLNIGNLISFVSSTGSTTVASLNAGSGKIETTGNISGWNMVANSLTTNLVKTNSLSIPGAVEGQVLTAVDGNGTVEWKSPAAIAAASGGGGLPSESIYLNPAFNNTVAHDFVVPDGVTEILVELSGGGGSSGYPVSGSWFIIPAVDGNAGQTSSISPDGVSPSVYATGGNGGTKTSAGANGSGVGGFMTSSLFSVSPYGVAALEGYRGGNGGYVKGIINVTPGSTLKAIVGAGGAPSTRAGATAGNAGFVHITYLGTSEMTPLQRCANAGGQAIDANGNCTYKYGSTTGTGGSFASIFGWPLELHNDHAPYVCANIGGHSSWTYLSKTTETHTISCGNLYGLVVWSGGVWNTVGQNYSCANPTVTVPNSVTCKIPII